MAAQPERPSIFANYATSVRGMIVGLHLSGLPPNAIKEQVGCNIKTVRLWIRKFEEEGYDGLCDHRQNNKRPKVTTAEEDVQLLRHVDEHPHTTIADALAITRVPASVSTARRRLAEVALTAHRPQKKTPLTENHREQRLRYAREHVGWTAEQWAPIIWSDEKVFNSADDGCRHVYRPRGTQFMLDPKYVVEKQWSGRITGGFWGCMSASGVMALHEIPPRMNANHYINILETVMLPCARARFPAAEYPVLRFMHDNSAVHTARITRAWFEQHPEILVMDHLSRSPDLNPIENLWAVMVKDWVSGADSTREALVAHVQETWENLQARPELTQKLVASMPKRLQSVIDNDGYWIPY